MLPLNLLEDITLHIPVQAMQLKNYKNMGPRYTAPGHVIKKF